MSAFTNFAENKVIDYFRGQGLTLPTDWHIGLLEGFDSDENGLELVGSDYARQPATRSLTAWAGTQGAGSTLASTGTSHATSNNLEIDFGNAIEGEVTHFGLYDAATGGNLWAAIPLAVPQTINLSDPVTFAAGEIAITLGLSGGLSNYASNKLIDLIFRAQAYAWPSTTYVAYTTTLPTNAVAGTEPAGGYARVAIASSLTAWSSTQGDTAASSGEGGRMSNLAAITFPVPTANQGDIVGHMIMDASTSGNMLFRGPMLSGGVPAAFTVTASGDAPRFEAGSYGVTVL